MAIRFAQNNLLFCTHSICTTSWRHLTPQDPADNGVLGLLYTANRKGLTSFFNVSQLFTSAICYQVHLEFYYEIGQPERLMVRMFSFLIP